MPRKKSISGTEPKGDFISTNIIMGGKRYKIVEVAKKGDEYYCTLKNEAGEFKEFKHDALLKLVNQKQPV